MDMRAAQRWKDKTWRNHQEERERVIAHPGWSKGLQADTGRGAVYRRREQERTFNSALYTQVALLEQGNRSLNTKDRKMTLKPWLRDRCCTCSNSKSDILFTSLFIMRSWLISQMYRAKKVNFASLAKLLPSALVIMLSCWKASSAVPEQHWKES